ncbi:amino acid adenylation domain-containing protein [Streptomyces sp. NPDC029554]|uniref:non-ribosomal peptide synthetase n=1 Tax=Streptomyces sp. NPDC029554 TaxID=3155126 RepID=UPI0034031D0F
MIDKDNIESITGLAAMQKGMLFQHAADAGSDAYVEQFDFTGSGRVDAGHLRTALAALSRHYAVLRSVFSFRNTDEPYRVILKEWAPPLDLLDHSGTPDAEQAVAAFKAADRARGFDLTRDVLLRATLIDVGGERWHLVLTFHHVILDGWSLGPLFGTLFGYYDELVRTGTLRQRRETHPYADYLAWYGRQRGEDALAHWTRELDGYERPAGLPTDRRADGYRGATHRFTVPDELWAAVRRLARENRVTPSAVFQAAWGVVLQKFTYTDDVVFGSVVSGRDVDVDGVEDMVGLLVNTQPVRVAAGETTGFADLCRSVQDAYRRAVPYQYCPLHEVQSRVPLKNELLNHVLAFENYPLAGRLREFGSGDGLRLEGVEVYERTDYDFHVIVHPLDQLEVAFTYNANLYRPALMEALQAALVRVFTVAVDDPAVPVRRIALLDPAAQAGTGREARPAATAPQPTLVETFDAITRTHGDRTALVRHGKEYTYRAIDRWSDAVAARLKEHGVGPGAPVGVLADRRPELIVAMLGVLKSGNHYVPVDTKDAAPRIEDVLDDAGVRVLCTVGEFTGKAPDRVTTLLVDELPTDAAPFPRVPSSPDSVAYLMYTSGSTGRPKGCHITHRNIQRLFTDQTYAAFGDDQTVVMTSSPAFDACTFEIWGTLGSGGTLVLPEEVDILDGTRLRALAEHHGARRLWLTTSLFHRLADHDPEMFRTLDHLLVGGTVLSRQHTARVLDACPGLRITNFYGPTENTVFSTAHPIRAEDLDRDRVPIGRVLNHTTAHVLDNGLNPLPPGATGELCLGGDGVSPGYLNRPELTREKFVTVPALPGERLYRTGDLVRREPDGTLDYLGRTDDQVKINGFRVELGEVEALLASVDGVTEAVVVAAEEDGAKTLRGYYRAAGDLTPEAVRSALTARVAGYLVPAVLLRMESFPLNKSGKVDRGRLAQHRPEPRPGAREEAGRPLSATERTLLDIVSDLLPGADIDPDRNFFDLGLNSLHLLTIGNRLRKTLGREVPVPLFFEHTSVSALAAHLDTPDTDGRSASGDALAGEREEEQAALATGRLLMQLGDD